MTKPPFIRWPYGPIYLLLIPILLFMVPKKFEGPVLFTFSDGQSLTLLNTLAIIPLFVALFWIQRGLWKRRIYLFNRITIYPGAGSLIVFLMGLSLGMLIASGFNDFNYWWAVGGLLFIIILIAIMLKSRREEG